MFFLKYSKRRKRKGEINIWDKPLNIQYNIYAYIITMDIYCKLWDQDNPFKKPRY